MDVRTRRRDDMLVYRTAAKRGATAPPTNYAANIMSIGHRMSMAYWVRTPVGTRHVVGGLGPVVVSCSSLEVCSVRVCGLVALARVWSSPGRQRFLTVISLLPGWIPSVCGIH